MPSTSMMSARNLPPPLPARKNLPPVRKSVPVSRAHSAVGRPLPAPPTAESTQKNTQTMPNRNKKSPVNYENHEIGMTKNKSLPAEMSKLNVETPPPPPPGRPPRRSETIQGTRSTHLPKESLDVPPAVPRRDPPRKPSCSSLPSPSSPRNDTFPDLESRFPFHDESDLPPPEPYVGDNKSYASQSYKHPKQKGSMKRTTPELPPS